MADSDNDSGGKSSHLNRGDSLSSYPKEQDRFLPIANVSRIMKKALPANAKISKDAKETVQECVSEFISFITGEASDKCQREKRKTINGDDLLWAMTTLGFEEYVEPLKVYLQRFRELEGERTGLGPPVQGSNNNSNSNSNNNNTGGGEIAVHRVKKEEVETKIASWQTAKIAKINNRFKREDAVISGWENEQVLKATSWMKKVERKLEEKRAKATEKMQNDIAKAHRKAEDRRASAEGKRGVKVARVLEVANLMRAVGRPPAKRSFF